jgi:hypothetical protein
MAFQDVGIQVASPARSHSAKKVREMIAFIATLPMLDLLAITSEGVHMAIVIGRDDMPILALHYDTHL